MKNQYDPQEDFEFARLPWRVRVAEWWQEATGPIEQGPHLTMKRAVLGRVKMWTPVVLVLFLVVAVTGIWIFTGWRAGDLAAKAVRNAEAGNLRMAQLQVESARRLRKNNTDVLRAAAMVGTMAGQPAAPSAWESLPEGLVLSPAELRQKAVAMTRFGSDRQHRQAIEALQKEGLAADAAARSAERRNARGDLGRAVALAREAAEAEDSPSNRLFLARLLAARHGPLLIDPNRTTDGDVAAMMEIADLVDSLLDSPLRREALALGLQAPQLPESRRVAWARSAFEDRHHANPALLPAAYVLRDFNALSPEELQTKMSTAYAGAPLSSRVAFATFLTASGKPEAALGLVSEEEAALDASAFDARARALSAEGRWDDMLAMAADGRGVPEALRELTRAEAAVRTGHTGLVEKCVPLAIRASVREGSLPAALERADALGEGPRADAVLVEMCGDAERSDYAFAVARERFGRRGQFASLRAAHQNASAADGKGAAARDFKRYGDLLQGVPVDPAETAGALAAYPADLDHRMTHALALLRAGRADEAWSVFDDFTVFYDELRPGHQAVMSAIVAAKGDPVLAAQAARKIDIDLLFPDEYLLVGGLRAKTRDDLSPAPGRALPAGEDGGALKVP